MKIMGKSLPEDYVVTPLGARHKSHVHLIEAGHTIDASGGRLRVYDKNSRSVQDFGDIQQKAVHQQKLTHRLEKSVAIVPSPAAHFIVSGDFENDTGSPILSFSTSWVVPSAPLSHSGQIVFIWNGITRLSSPMAER